MDAPRLNTDINFEFLVRLSPFQCYIELLLGCTCGQNNNQIQKRKNSILESIDS